MKQKFKNSSDSDYVQRKTDYSKGEKSPYREHISSRNQGDEDGEETPYGNPDLIAETGTPWFRKEATVEQKELVAVIMKELTPRQRKILELVGLEGKSMDHAAVILGVKKSTIQTTVERIRQKFISKLSYGGL